MIVKKNGRRLKMQLSLFIFLLIMICPSVLALKLERNKRNKHTIKGQILVNLEPRSADSYNEVGTGWFS